MRKWQWALDSKEEQELISGRESSLLGMRGSMLSDLRNELLIRECFGHLFFSLLWVLLLVECCIHSKANRPNPLCLVGLWGAWEREPKQKIQSRLVPTCLPHCYYCIGFSMSLWACWNWALRFLP